MFAIGERFISRRGASRYAMWLNARNLMPGTRYVYERQERRGRA